MSRAVTLGIDLGTSSVRAMLVDEAAQVVTSVAREYPILAPRPGWAEQDPGSWWRATCDAVREAVTAAGEVTVTCIGFSGQMHGTVLTGEQGAPLRPAIIWADQRSGREVAGFLRTVSPGTLAQETANPLATGFQLATLLWLKEHEPDVLRSARMVLLPKDWLRLKMTGVAATDPSDACSTLLFNTGQRDWSRHIVEAAGLRLELFPPVMRSTDVSGELQQDAAHDLGLPRGTPVAVGAGDTPATALGNGVIDPGTIQCTIGSGGQLVVPTGVLQYDPELRTHTFCHVPDNRWYVMGATLSAGLSLKWLRQSVLGRESLEYAALSEEASAVAPGAEGLVFLPYLTGERTPHMDPNSCGVFFGLTPRHGRAHLVRAVMEGVVFALREGLDVITSLGIEPQTVVATGGGARSPLWRQIQADVFGVPVRQAIHQEAAAYGAARIAGCAVGWWPNVADVPKHDPISTDLAEPDPASAARYAELFGMYRDLYAATREIMAKRVHIVEDHLSG